MTPTQAITFNSSNAALVSVNASGLCTAAADDPNILETGGTAQIEINYPWANEISSAKIYAFVGITVTVPAAYSRDMGGTAKNYPIKYFS